MCGICGQFNFRNQEPVSFDSLKSMSDSIAHRGPDDEGHYISGSLGLGFRRLSIIDLQSGQQPMSDSAKTVWVVFNGEIYNFLELRKELKSYGHVFRTNSDTEVIVHGYKQWGELVFSHLNGMFGIAIWDEEKRELIIARDRMGIKFIYYKLEPDRIIFGSEIRPLLVNDIVSKPEFDPDSMSLFLRYRFTPSPLTIYKDIRKLAPGTLMVVSEEGSIIEKRWWNYKPNPFKKNISISDAEEMLLELYSKAVKRQLVSDVPLGLLLSGGVDSALLLALMNINGSHWPTFTVGYGKSFKDDELEDAAQTAKVLHSNHYQVQIGKDRFQKSLSDIISVIEEPIATSSIVPMYYVCELARQNVKTAMIGQGPDELFGGYQRHLGIDYGKYWRNLPYLFRQLIKPVLKKLPRSESIKRGLFSLDIPDRMKRYQNVLSLMSGASIENLFIDDVLSPGASEQILDCWSGLEPLLEKTGELGGFNFIEIRSTLPDELLLYADKISMSHGLELRVPFIDQEIVQFVERLPDSFRINRGRRKWIHKRVAEKYLPGEIINRPKRGFASNVVDSWFRESAEDRFSEILLDEDSCIYDFLKSREVSRLLSDHQKGICDNHKILFSIIVLEEILRKYK